MCHISIIKRLDNKPVESNILIPTLVEQLDHNKDGAWFYANQTSDVFEIKTMSGKKARRFLRQHSTDSLNWLMCHFRFATSGQKTIANIHGFEADNWLFAHNGTCSSLSNGIGAKKSDSLNFFELLLPLLPKDHNDQGAIKRAIDETMTNYDLSGRFILYSQVTDKLYIVGYWHIYQVGNLLWIGSSDLDFKGDKETKKNKVEIAGFSLSEEQPHIKISEGSLFGVGVIHDMSKPDFKYEWLAPVVTYTHIYNYSSGYTPHPSGFGFSVVKDDETELEVNPLLETTIERNGKQYLICGINGYGEALIWHETEGLHDTEGRCCQCDTCAENWDYVSDNIYDLMIDSHYADKLEACKIEPVETPAGSA